MAVPPVAAPPPSNPTASAVPVPPINVTPTMAPNTAMTTATATMGVGVGVGAGLDYVKVRVYCSIFYCIDSRNCLAN